MARHLLLGTGKDKKTFRPDSARWELNTGCSFSRHQPSNFFVLEILQTDNQPHYEVISNRFNSRGSRSDFRM